MDGQTGSRYSGGVNGGEIITCVDGYFGSGGNFAFVFPMEFQRFFKIIFSSHNDNFKTRLKASCMNKTRRESSSKNCERRNVVLKNSTFFGEK
jgi:hypothetical protein